MSTIRISKLTDKGSVKGFQCGEHEIDRWVANKATKFSEQSRSKVFIAHTQGQSAAKGLYSLSFSQEESGKLAGVRDRDIWSGGVPLIFLNYIAVHRGCQQCGLGTVLLMDCLHRVHFVSEHVAFYGVGLRSLNARTTKLYTKFGFGMAKDEEKSSTPLMILPIWSLNDLFGTR